MRRRATANSGERLFAVLALGAYALVAVGVLTTGVAIDVVVLVLGAAVGLYVHRLRRRARRLRSTVDELRARQVERSAVISGFERARRTDAVTGLGNREHLDAALPRLVTEASSSMSSLALLVLELDRLASHREAHGEDATNRVLKRLAADWQGHMRINDVLVRVTDAEFVVVLPACSPPNAHRVAERLAGAAPQELACSVGVASWDGGERYEQLLDRAERATRAASGAGERVLVAD